MKESDTHTAPLDTDKRTVILQAAWGLIRHYGYGKTTIGDIAKRAQVGKGTVYLYFRSKNEIMLALADITNQRITEALEQIAAGPGTPRERLRACLLYRLTTLYDLVHRYPHSDDVIASLLPEIVERLDRFVVRHGELLARILRDGRSSGEFKTADPDAAGQLLSHLFEFMTPPYYRFRSREALELFANDVVDLLVSGL